MFNFKKIGITFSILALVGLTGALMVGPVFAGPGGGGKNPKTNVCHYQEEVDEVRSTDGLNTVEVAHEDQHWANIYISDNALMAHMGDGTELVAPHTDANGRGSDWIIDNSDEDLLTADDGTLYLDTSDDTPVCDALLASYPEVEHAH